MPNTLEEQAEDLIGTLTDYFHDNQPDDDFLEEDEGASDEIESVENIINDSNSSQKEKLKSLYHYNNAWFPDGLSESEKAEQRANLDAAKDLIQKL